MFGAYFFEIFVNRRVHNSIKFEYPYRSQSRDAVSLKKTSRYVQCSIEATLY